VRSDARASVFSSTETAAGLRGHNFSDRLCVEIGIGPTDVNVNVMMTFMPSSRTALYALAERHSGWFRASDAVAAGVTRQQLTRYAASTVLLRSGHGVYRLRDFPAQPFEDVIETCLWAGPNAVASHDTALAIYGLGNAMPASIHITVPHRLRKQRRGVIVHVTEITAAEITTRDSAPITSVPRTLRDVAADVPASEVSGLITEAEDRGLLRHREAAALRKELAVAE
jgi:predicted transcriptional regulator of viral defense system